LAHEAKHDGARNRRRAAGQLVACAAVIAAGCAEGAEPHHRANDDPPAAVLLTATRVTDLLDKGHPDGPRVLVEEFDGDYRTSWVTTLSASIRVSLNLAADDCELVVGMRANGDGTAAGKRVVARVSKRVGAVEKVILEEALVSVPDRAAPWRDRSALVPGDGASAPERADLVFSAERPDGGSIDGITVSWSTPHVVCRSLPVVRRGPPRTPHVVFVSIDSLRADHMSLYGYRRETSPFLDRFASRAVVFEQAFSTAPWTAPAHASMFTGLYPEQHQAGRSDPFAPLADDIDTMATILRRQGYRTLGFAAGGVMAPESGLGQGFDRYESHARTRLRSFFPGILEEVERHSNQPLFLFVHTYDVHGPYIQPRGMRAFEADEGDPHVTDEEWARIRKPGPHDYQRLGRFEGLQDVVAAYDSGIHYTDRELGMLFGQLRQAGLLDHALVIVTSDHGEVLYDRKLFIGHTFTLHDEALRVPLIVRRVGHLQGERSTALTDSTDLLPMVLEELGIELPSALAGRNPLRPPHPGEPHKAFVRGEATHTGAAFIRTDRHKVLTAIRNFNDPRSLLPGALRDRIEQGTIWYDLIADTGEHRNRYAAEAPAREPAAAYLQLERVLNQKLEASRAREGETARELSEEEEDALRSLGYTE